MPQLLLLLLLLLLRRCATAGYLLLLLNSQQLHPGWRQAPLLMQGTQLVQALLLRLLHTLLLPLLLMQVLLQALLLRLRHIKLPVGVVRQWLHICGDDPTIDALLHTLLRNWLLIAAWDRQARPAGLAAHVCTLKTAAHAPQDVSALLATACRHTRDAWQQCMSSLRCQSSKTVPA
jgi:hypothetical protein